MKRLEHITTAQINVPMADLPNSSLTAPLPPELPELTNKQILCLAFIYNYRNQRQRPPTATEIALAMDLKSRQAARSYIDALEKKKCVRRDRNKARRNLIITTTGRRVLNEAKVIDSSGQIPLFNMTGTHIT